MAHLYEIQLRWIHKLQDGMRGPITDPFFIFFNSLDSAWFVLLFVACIMYLFNRKEGVSILFLFILSGAINMVLKQLFHSPRPCQIDPSIGILCFKSFGFPSGASQTGTLVAGIALTKCRSNWLRIIGVLFGLTMCFSRIYLGVHFITDVLGGIAIGVGLLFIYVKLFPLIEDHFAKFAFCLTALFLFGGKAMLSHMCISLGIGIGLLFLDKLELPKSWALRFLTLLIVIVGTVLLQKLQVKAVEMALIGFWFIYLGNQIVKRALEIAERRH